MREWLTTATGCNCEALDVCALFDTTPDGSATTGVQGDSPLILSLTLVGA
jgi:hypothetical protein